MIFGAFPFIILDLSLSHLVSQLCLWGHHFLEQIDEMVVIELASVKRLFGLIKVARLQMMVPPDMFAIH